MKKPATISQKTVSDTTLYAYVRRITHTAKTKEALDELISIRMITSFFKRNSLHKQPLRTSGGLIQTLMEMMYSPSKTGH